MRPHAVQLQVSTEMCWGSQKWGPDITGQHGDSADLPSLDVDKFRRELTGGIAHQQRQNPHRSWVAWISVANSWLTHYSIGWKLLILHQQKNVSFVCMPAVESSKPLLFLFGRLRIFMTLENDFDPHLLCQDRLLLDTVAKWPLRIQKKKVWELSGFHLFFWTTRFTKEGFSGFPV